jgi:hypothetical protein
MYTEIDIQQVKQFNIEIEYLSYLDTSKKRQETK